MMNFESFEISKTWKRKLCSFCKSLAWRKTTQTLLLTKVRDFESFETKKLKNASRPLGEKLPKDIFWQNWRLLKTLKQKLENAKFVHLVSFPLWWKTTKTLVWTKLEVFQSFEAAASNIWKCKLCPFCKPPDWWKNYLKTSFDKSKSFNKQEADKMKKICSNQVLEPTFSNQVLKIDVDCIEKFINCSLQGGPFGGPACPPVLSYL